MDTEQQIRLNFLDEAEEYFDNMETNLLGLADTVVDIQKIDIILRAAHSIKGGAAMMGFSNLSKIAHRLEDFLKILRVRYASETIQTEVETLLLQSVDYLRDFAKLNRQNVELAVGFDDNSESEFSDQIQPIFVKLQQQLGELQEEDEDALMSAQDGDVDPALLIFEEGVESVLDSFESRLPNLGIEELAQELVSTSQELVGFGYMANLEPFIQLCNSIEEQAFNLSSNEISSFASKALKAWKRSHALVLRGNLEKLPASLEGAHSSADSSESNQSNDAQIDSSTFEFFEEEATLDINALESAFGEPVQFESDVNLDVLQSAFAEKQPEEDLAAEERQENPENDSFLPIETVELFDNNISLDGLSSELEKLEQFNVSTEEEFVIPADAEAQLSDVNLDALQSAFDDSELAKEQPDQEDIAFDEFVKSISANAKSDHVDSLQQQKKSKAGENQIKIGSASKAEKMIRVSTSQLRQFNNLFEQLILDRNSINTRLEQLRDVSSLLGQRMKQMESSNAQLKQWYDRASVEGFLNYRDTGNSNNNLVDRSQSLIKETTEDDSFDALEMDQYSDVHLICQEQIETIVQLQEVTTDIELSIQELNQSVRELNYTTKSMRGNVTGTQMLPFAEILKRFPRVVRDLNLQFNKQVELKTIGENTLLDRSVINTLGDPLMHLFRNAFDHGIESPEDRLAAGKPSSGTITIKASNQGTYSVITIQDDGGGISIEKIRDRIAKMGIPRAEILEIPEKELLDFIFEPGFSTANQVTELSGRGVGMDVVRTNLKEIRGDVSVSTEEGKGSTFTLKIPFSISILRVAVVEQAGIVFAIPVNTIQELIPCGREEVTTDAGKGSEFITWDNAEIPLIKIDETLTYYRPNNNFSLNGNPTIDDHMALVVGEDKLSAAFKISRFWYEQESTIRPIDSPIPLPPGFISSVVFGDGTVIPLIDPILLIEACLQETHAEKFASEQASPADKFMQPETKNILVVDDSINVRRYLSLTLEKAGYRVEQAKDGQEAVDKLIGGLDVQAVVCDIEMPRLDGYGVLEEIKERAEFSDLPIAMLTSRSNEKHRKLAMNLGASAYFSKPYNEQELLSTLETLINNSQLVKT